MDPILYWNDVALEANRISHTNGKNEQTGPTLSSRALAIVHLAMYDAYFGVTGNYSAGMAAYLPDLPPPPFLGPGGNVVAAAAAVAAAAHATLSALFPSQRDFFDRKHQEAGLEGEDIAAGHDFGLRVARCLLTDRKDDPDASDAGYAPSMARGRHRVDPDNPGQGYHAPFYGACSKLFAASERHELDAPPSPGHPGQAPDAKYTEALEEVYTHGIAPELMGTLPGAARRTAEQTLVGIYWAYDGVPKLGTPPRFYNLILRKVSEQRGLTPAENAQLFALVNVAMGDAGILAWEQKYVHDFWRPVVGIREHDFSMGPAGTDAPTFLDHCDPGWLPLGSPSSNPDAKERMPSMSSYPCGHVVKEAVKNFTPPFPAYPSGHATFGAAAFHIAWLYFNRDNNGPKEDPFKNLEFVSEELNGLSRDHKGTVRPRHLRKFPNGRFDLIEENGVSRVYLGVHWEFDAFLRKKDGSIDFDQNVGGVPLGIAIAEDIFSTTGKTRLEKSTIGPRGCCVKKSS